MKANYFGLVRGHGFAHFWDFCWFQRKIMSTDDLLSWEYALTGYEEQIISFSLLLPVAVYPSVDRVLSNCCEYVRVPSEKDCAVKTVYLQTKHGIGSRCAGCWTAAVAWRSPSWMLRRHTLAAGSIYGLCSGRRSKGVHSLWTVGGRISCCVLWTPLLVWEMEWQGSVVIWP